MVAVEHGCYLGRTLDSFAGHIPTESALGLKCKVRGLLAEEEVYNVTSEDGELQSVLFDFGIAALQTAAPGRYYRLSIRTV